MDRMNDEDRKLLREIHEKLIGDLDTKGFIGEVDTKFLQMESRIAILEGFKKTNIGVIISIVGLVITRLLGLGI